MGALRQVNLMQLMKMELISEGVGEKINGGSVSISSTSTNISPGVYQNTSLNGASSGSLIQVNGFPEKTDTASEAIAFAQSLLNSIL